MTVAGIERLGLGTATFVPAYSIGGDSARRPELILEAAVEAGLAYVDTAAAYGQSELALGEYRGRLDSAGVRICTKVQAAGSQDPGQHEHAEFEASYDRLGRRPFDTLLLHSVDVSDLRRRSKVPLLSALRADGLVRHLGVSTYGVDAPALALELPWCDIVQVEFSVLNQSVIRHIAGRRSPGQEIVARSVLCKGLLTERSDAAPDLARAIAPDLAALRRLAVDWGLTLPELAIRFALDTPAINVVLVGVTSVCELDQALAAARCSALTAAQYQRLQAFDRSGFDCVHPERWGLLAGSMGAGL